MDRFLVRISMGYPARDAEWDMLARRAMRKSDDVDLSTVVDGPTLLAMQAAVEDVYVSEGLGYYMVDLAQATRSSTQVQVGASPRGSLALMKLARAQAALDGRDFCVPEDVKAIAVPALAHRLILRPELWVQRIRPEEVVRDCLARVPAPVVDQSFEP